MIIYRVRDNTAPYIPVFELESSAIKRAVALITQGGHPDCWVEKVTLTTGALVEMISRYGIPNPCETERVWPPEPQTERERVLEEAKAEIWKRTGTRDRTIVAQVAEILEALK